VTIPTRSPPPGARPKRFPARWSSDWGEDPCGLWQAFTYRGVRQGFRWIPPGQFKMGSPENEHGRDEDERRHDVILTRGIWVAETACTQALWQAVIGDNPSHFQGEQHPVEQVSWDDVQRFIERLNFDAGQVGRAADPPSDRHRSKPGYISLQPKPDLRFRLPTEAEWERACRAGTETPFVFGDDVAPEQVNYDGNDPYKEGKKVLSRQETVSVALLPANAWGLYEMHGNVWEWCHDCYGAYPYGPATDPAGSETGKDRVVRGGSWLNGGRFVRSACRTHIAPGFSNNRTGFRLAFGPELELTQRSASR
jgi:formylglycine-generating enzyme